MGLYYITFRSVTYAQRGEKLLTKMGFRVSLLRTPRWMEAQGCGYALKLWSNDLDQAVALLRENRVRFQRIYVQQPDGTLEEAGQ